MFHHPWLLLLLLLVPYAGWRIWSSSRQRSISYSSIGRELRLRPTWRQRLMWLPGALLIGALALMTVALARPRFGREQTVISSEGIAIEMVVDRSSSMQALDFQIDGRHVDRLTAIKNVAKKFVLGEEDAARDGALRGRVSDLVGLITFAGYADAISPPTLDHAYLMAQLEKTRIVARRSEDGTAIGDAISLAIEKLNSLDQRAEKTEKIESKVIILLTDGENTAGEIQPLQAAELARAMGIKIYTIGVGTKGRAPFPVRRSRTGQVIVQYQMVNIDEKSLRAIADATDGKYFRATDTQSLEAIYNEIDQLETTTVETQRFVDYRELAVQPAWVAGYRVPALLLIALLMLVARSLLANTILRRIA